MPKIEDEVDDIINVSTTHNYQISRSLATATDEEIECQEVVQDGVMTVEMVRAACLDTDNDEIVFDDL